MFKVLSRPPSQRAFPLLSNHVGRWVMSPLISSRENRCIVSRKHLSKGMFLLGVNILGRPEKSSPNNRYYKPIIEAKDRD